MNIGFFIKRFSLALGVFGVYVLAGFLGINCEESAFLACGLWFILGLVAFVANFILLLIIGKIIKRERFIVTVVVLAILNIMALWLLG